MTTVILYVIKLNYFDIVSETNNHHWWLVFPKISSVEELDIFGHKAKKFATINRLKGESHNTTAVGELGSAGGWGYKGKTKTRQDRCQSYQQ